MTATSFLLAAGHTHSQVLIGKKGLTPFLDPQFDVSHDPDVHGVVILDRLATEAKTHAVALALSEERLRLTQECLSSDDLGHSAVFRSGGSGPSGVRG